MSEIFDFEAQAAPMRAAAAERSPAEMLEQQQNLTTGVERNVVANALDVGELAPDFMPHQAGIDSGRSLAAALANSPVVLSFYRGQ